MEALELTTVINTLAVILAEEMTDDQLALWAAILTQAGDVLATIAVQRTITNSKT